MLRETKQFLITMMVALLGVGLMSTLLPANASGQTTPMPAHKAIIEKLEKDVDMFKSTIGPELDRSRLNGTEQEDMMSAYISELETSTDTLDQRADMGPVPAQVSRVLGDALRVESFLTANPMSANVTQSWNAVKMSLDQLAKHHNVAWAWSTSNVPAMSDETREDLISTLEERADTFRGSFASALDASRANDTPAEEHMLGVVRTFEGSLDELSGGGDIGRLSDEDREKRVLTVLNNAMAIQEYMREYQMTPQARLDWFRVRTHLDDLARAYKVAWTWIDKPGATAATPAADAKKPN